jgi:two-component system sensor histidine kinase PilS (NtrC family)
VANKPLNNPSIKKSETQALSVAVQFTSFVRIAFALLLLLSTFINMQSISQAILLELHYRLLLACLMEVFAFSAIIGLLLRTKRGIRAIFYVGLFHDALLASVFVLLSGYDESPFTYLFLIVPLYSGISLQRRGGVFGAIASTTVILLLFVALPLIVAVSHKDSLLPLYFQRLLVALDVTEAVINWQRLILLVLTCFGVGLLTGQLSHFYERTKGKLEQTSLALSAFKNLHEKILNALPNGVITTNAENSEIMYFNHAAATMFDFAEESRLQLREFFTPKLSMQMLERGERSYQVSCQQFVPAPKHALDLYIIEDISSLKEAQKILHRTQRLSVLGEFSAKIAHEIKNPLACVSGCVEMLTMDSKSEEEQTLLKLLSSETERLNKLLNNILVFSKKPKLNFTLQSIQEIIENTWELLARDQASTGIEFHSQIDVKFEEKIDETSFSQILLILWRNAIEAMNGEGSIFCELAKTDETVLQIYNTGPKIASEEESKIFDPFYSTKERGSGIGLAVAKQLAQDTNLLLRLNLSHEYCCFELVFNAHGGNAVQREYEFELRSEDFVED